MRKSHFGFPSFEILLAISLIAILFAVWADRYYFIREQAEKIDFEHKLANMRVGLMYEKARRITKGQPFNSLEGSNPVLYLEAPPAGYVGEKDSAWINQAAAGSWFFVSAEHTLYYKPYLSRYLQTGAPAIAVRIRGDWKIDGAYRWF